MNNSKLTWFIFGALILGVLFGWLFPDVAVHMKPFADLFLKMVKMIIAPLIFATLVVGIAGHGDMKSLGKISLKTIIYFEIVTTIALVFGLVSANILKPGVGFNLDLGAVSMSGIEGMNSLNVVKTTDYSIGGVFSTIAHLLVDSVPTSIFQALSEGNLLQIVVFAVFFAFAIGAVGQKARPVLNFLQSTCEIMFKFTEFVMLFAPLGVFGAIAVTIGQNGINILFNYAKLILVVYLVLLLFVLLVLSVVCFIVKIPFFAMVRAIKHPAILAFSTASSEAALPRAMDIMERFGVPKNIVSFVMPTGYTFNLDGSTIYLALTSLFCAQIVGVELSLQMQIAIMLTLMLTSKGIAGVPRVALVVLLGTLSGFDIPVIGVAILLGIDQILDMGRTTVNLIGNCVATTVIARWEHEFDFEKMENFLQEENIKLSSNPIVVSENPFKTNKRKRKTIQKENQKGDIK